jgi:uncharacterized membrane protein (DUF4010 family)
MVDLLHALPPDGIKMVVVLFLSFLLGLEREEHKAAAAEYAFGGVRTFPLIGLVGYAVALLSGASMVPVAIGLASVAGFLMLAYWHKLQKSETAGVTSEMSALATYMVGALVARDQFWVATTLSVVGLFLLELKVALEGLSRRIASDEILTFAKFLLLAVVILPILPDRPFTGMAINPFRTWTVVVAVSAVSYGSYVIERLTSGQGGVRLAALLGGAYSSTITTLALGRQAARERRPHLLSGATLIASGMMYLRLAVFVGAFNPALRALLGLPFVLLGAVAVAAGWLWSRTSDADAATVSPAFESKNPLEIGMALLFAVLFLAMLVATHLTVAYFGRGGLYSLAALMGITDVDPFILGMTQAAGTLTPAGEAGLAIVIAASSNNAVKGIYAYAVSDRRTGRMSLWLLIALALAGLLPGLWLTRG